jgi:hypothetical protein
MKVLALRSRPAGGGFKPPPAALAEDRRGERGGKGAPRGHQAGIGKTNVSDSLMKCRYLSLGGIKIGAYPDGPKKSLAGARRLAGGVRHVGDVSPICCSRTERGKACPDTVAPGVGWREGVSQADETVRDRVPSRGRAGGLACSSDEASVTGVERRGQVIRGCCFIGQPGEILEGAWWTS